MGFEQGMSGEAKLESLLLTRYERRLSELMSKSMIADHLPEERSNISLP